MQIEVLVKRPGVALPPLAAGQLRYVAAENGVFLERQTKHYRTSCQVDPPLAGLAVQDTYCELSFQQLPPQLIAEMLGFFRWAYEKHGGEAALVLLYHEEQDEYSWACPRQTVELWQNWWGYWYPAGTIEYEDPTELPPGCVAFGDAHSHADLGAHPSAMDEEDEQYKDGLHMIVGRLHMDDVDFHISFVMDGTRFRVAPELILGSAVPDLEVDFPPEWTQQVIVERRAYDQHAPQPAKSSGALDGALPTDGPSARNTDGGDSPCAAPPNPDTRGASEWQR